MIDIVVVGYPKSGTTWVTRLVAELVDCKVKGFLGSDHNELAIEGLHRKSDYEVYKSHHQFHELQEFITKSSKIIYVVRDPRDISISGSRYFKFNKWPLFEKVICRFSIGVIFYNRVLRKIILSKTFRISKMTKAVLFGGKEIHHWLRIPWEEHLNSYLESHCLILKYEDLLDDPKSQCMRILKFLNLNRTEQQVSKAIENQSFTNKKNEFRKKNDIINVKFMKVGKKEQWKRVLSKKQNKIFLDKLSDRLNQLGYQIDANMK